MKNNNVKDYYLNFSECEYLGEVHREIKEKLELPDWYGENLDALWDSITGLMYTPSNINITYMPETKKAEFLRDEIYKIIDVFKEAQEEYKEITVSVIN